MTSGFNIGTNYTLSYAFNEMTGFTEEEVRDMLTYYTETCNIHTYTVDELIAIMRPWYDNYCFAKKAYGKTTMYNSCMVFYFIDNFNHPSEPICRQRNRENACKDYTIA